MQDTKIHKVAFSIIIMLILIIVSIFQISITYAINTNSLLHCIYYGIKNRNLFYITSNLINEKKYLEIFSPLMSLLLSKDKVLLLEATKAYYFEDKFFLCFKKKITIYYNGYSVHTDRVTINTKNWHASGDSTVYSCGSFTTVRSDGFHILNKGRTVFLTGQSLMLLQSHAF